MTINRLRKQGWLSLLLAPVLLVTLIGVRPVFAADLTITAASTGTAILTQNGGSTVTTFTPALGTTIEQNASTSAVAYYGVHVTSATTTGDVHWRITVSHATDALTTGDVTITEKGFFDADSNDVADSAYTATASTSGDIIFEGNAGWETFAGDDFTNVDEISFDPTAPLGVYTITRELVDTASDVAIDGNYVFTTELVAAAAIDTTAPTFGTTTDIFATATTSGGVTVNFTNPTSTDDTDVSVDVTCSPQSGTNFSVGTTTVTCTAEDDAGNTATTTFNVIVELDAGSSTPGDITITHPVFASGLFCATSTPVLLEGTADANSNITVTGGLGTATTTANGSGAWSTMINLASNATSTVFVSVTDSGDNEIASTTLNFAFDTTAPVITLNGSSVVNIGTNDEFDDPGVSVSDNLDANVVATTTSDVNFAVEGTYTITYEAIDCAGNTASVTRTVNVDDDLNTGSGGSSGSASGRRNAIPGLTNAAGVANPNSAVAYVLAGFVIDGNAGLPGIPNTGLALGHFLRDLRPGDRGEDVTALQVKLTSTGLYTGPITGYFGPMTQAAVRRLQSGLSLPVTGNLDASTRTVLNNS